MHVAVGGTAEPAPRSTALWQYRQSIAIAPAWS